MMTAPNKFLPDVEQALIDHLQSRFPAESFGTRKPNPRPHRFIRLFRTGGNIKRQIREQVLVTIEVFDKDREGDAATLAGFIREELIHTAWARTPLVNSGVLRFMHELTTSGPISLPTTDGWARYTFNAQFSLDIN